MRNHITKLISIILALVMLSAFAACTKPGDTTDNNVKAPAGVALDLTQEWEDINGENTLVQGCLVVNTAWAASHPNELAKFLADYKASVEYVKSGTDEAINTVVSAGILPKAGIVKKALPKCNLCYIAGADMKSVMNTFSQKIFEYDEKSIGGAMPTDYFYYTEGGDASAASKTEEIKIYALNGTTALGMAQMIESSKNKTAEMNYNISLHTAADAITGAIISGECNIAALPTNVAVKLFNKSGGKLQLLALNTLGVLYLLNDGTQNVTSLADLKSKTIYLPGAGSNPEYITAALLKAAGLEIGKDVILDTTTYNSPDALQAAFAAGKAPLAVLPEPKVTVALSAINSAN